MALSTCSDYALGSGCISADFSTSYVQDPWSYSTVGKQDMALKVPLGSQLALLNASFAGNPYVQYDAVAFQKLGSLQNVLVGYNTMGQNTDNGSYFTFGRAYGRF